MEGSDALTRTSPRHHSPSGAPDMAGQPYLLQGHTVALLLIIAFFCLKRISEEDRARRVILLYVVRAMENVCTRH